jgi:3-isopropylmalate/(R)-2-methylmalate dehydratase small subunit
MRSKSMTKISEVKGRAVAVPGDDIDTDRIIPARYLKEITFTHMGDYPFFDERFDGSGNKKDHPFNRPEHQGASVLIANSNFGCGSSREHAPQALVRWGIRAIVAESFAEIFAGNCIMLGTPVATASPEHISRMQEIAGGSPEIEFTSICPPERSGRGTRFFRSPYPKPGGRRLPREPGTAHRFSWQTPGRPVKLQRGSVMPQVNCGA